VFVVPPLAEARPVVPAGSVAASALSSRFTRQPGQTVRLSAGICVRSSPQLGQSVGGCVSDSEREPPVSASASSITGVRSNIQIGQVERRSDGIPVRSAPQSGHSLIAPSSSLVSGSDVGKSPPVNCVAQCLQKLASARTSLLQFGHCFIGVEGDVSTVVSVDSLVGSDSSPTGNNGCCHSPQLGFGHQPRVSDGSKCLPQMAHVASSGTLSRIISGYEPL